MRIFPDRGKLYRIYGNRYGAAAVALVLGERTSTRCHFLACEAFPCGFATADKPKIFSSAQQ